MMSARLFSALRELADATNGGQTFYRRFTSMAVLQAQGLAVFHPATSIYFATYEITPAGRKKLAEMEAQK